jgi:hypothetical protein
VYQYSDVNTSATSRVTVFDPFSGVTIADSNAFGQVVKATDVRGAITSTAYDSVGQAIMVKGSSAVGVTDR